MRQKGSRKRNPAQIKDMQDRWEIYFARADVKPH